MDIIRTELARLLENDLAEGLSRRDLARKAKVSEGTIRNALDGKPLTHEMLERFAKFYFKVPIEEMYRMAGIFPTDDTHRGEAIRIIEYLMAKLPEADQQEILEIVRVKVARQEKEGG